jgi:hypothetical protein
LPTEEDVTIQVEGWIENGTDNDLDTETIYDNVVEHIELQFLKRPLTYLEKACVEKQYVITLLKLWLKKCLDKAFQYMKNEENYIDNMPTVLSQLDSIKSFKDIRSKLKDVESPLSNWCDWKCQYLQLILEQEYLFINTHRFTIFVNCYLKQFKTSCIENLFTRCLNDIVTDKKIVEKPRKFIEDLNVFLSNVNEEKNLKDLLENEQFQLCHNVKDENNTREAIFKLLMGKLSSETVQGGPVARPEWLQTFLSTAETLSDDEWTSKLRFLTKETCKRFLLPKTDTKIKEENGRQIISIEAVVIFVSKVIQKMTDWKMRHSGVQEIEMVGWKSVHIDCDLDNENEILERIRKKSRRSTHG